MTFDEMHSELFQVVSRYGARPDVPLEAESFFTELVGRFDDRDTCRRFLDDHAAEWFRCLSEPPVWIQEAEWQWEGGKPMVFVGSIDAPMGTLHDDARFFLFWSPDFGTTKCVIQIA